MKWWLACIIRDGEVKWERVFLEGSQGAIPSLDGVAASTWPGGVWWIVSTDDLVE
jgi:hypothetical protein